jgi:RNA polymerase sigma-70 factor (ECF subfamily)
MNEEMPVDERRLIRAAQRGEARAERALFEAHVDRIWRLTYRMTGDEALAEDMVQETFVRAFERLDGFRGDAAFSSWLHTIAVSVTLNALRKTKRTRDHELAREDMGDLAAASPGPDGGLRRDLDRAVASLDDNHRMVFVMHDLEGFTHEEIADSMGTPVGTAKARLSRARGKLRAWFEGGDALRLELES